MFADFWTEIVSTDVLSSFELRIISIILKQLNFKIWMVIDYKSIAKKLNLDAIEVTEVVQKLIGYEIIECKGDSLQKSCYRYRLNSNFGWNKSIYWVFADGINWQAFLNSFKKLQREFELIIRGIENKLSGILVVHIEVSALADRTEVEQSLRHEYSLQLKVLEKKYKTEHSDRDIILHQENSGNLLKIIELIANASNNFDKITDTKASSSSESEQVNLDHNSIIDREEIDKNSLPIELRQQQTLAEAVAEKEKLSNQLNLTEANQDKVDRDKIEYLDEPVSNQDEGNVLKRRIKTRLDKHCR